MKKILTFCIAVLTAVTISAREYQHSVGIAAGSGTKLDDVNRLMKQFEQTRKMMKMVTGLNSSKMAQMAAAMKMRGGMPKF